MNFIKSKWFKYLKNLIIGLGAAAVMLGALGKINSEPWGGTMITVGLLTEATIFMLLGVIPPEKDYSKVFYQDHEEVQPQNILHAYLPAHSVFQPGLS